MYVAQSCTYDSGDRVVRNVSGECLGDYCRLGTIGADDALGRPMVDYYIVLYPRLGWLNDGDWAVFACLLATLSETIAMFIFYSFFVAEDPKVGGFEECAGERYRMFRLEGVHTS